VRRLALLGLPTVALVASVLLLSPGPSAADDRARPPLIDAPTREAIERGLRFLARTQNADGSWTSDAGHKVNEEYAVVPGGKNVPHVGVTALGILAFLAAGHVPGRGPYGAVVDRAVGFLLSRVQDEGFIARDGTRMYSHAFATLALAEVYGMSRAPRLKENLDRAVALTVKCQNETGGWRYAPFVIDSDMSVTVCQVVALRAAMNVGIKVRKETIDRALRYVVDSAITSDTGHVGGDSRTIDEEVGGFLYQPRSTQWNRSSFSLTAAGLTTLFQAGIYDDQALKRYVETTGDRRNPPPSIKRAIDYMDRTYEEAAQKPNHYFFFYGNYYAAQAMYNIGAQEPARWERWYDRVRRTLLASQGSGRPGTRPDETYWESNVGETHTFGTAVAILILSMPFDYLPIHQK
jgi:hypothetical protein